MDLDVLLLVGVDYDEVVNEEEVVVDTITRYNCNTGVPYEVQKKKTIWKIGERIFNEEYEAHMAIEDVDLCVYEYDGQYILIGECLDNNKGERVATGLGGYVTEAEVNKSINNIEKALGKFDLVGMRKLIFLRTYSQASW